MARKFYVVWSGRQTGVFTDWATTQRAVDKYAGARFKSFPTRAEAEQAFGRGGYSIIPPTTPSRQKAGTANSERSATHPSQQFDISIYCDGACEPNPGNAGSGIVVYRAGAGIAGVGFTGTIAINADNELLRGMGGTAFAVRCAGFLPAGGCGWNDRVAAPTKCLLCFRTGREGLEARPGILVHGPLSGRPIREYTGLPS